MCVHYNDIIFFFALIIFQSVLTFEQEWPDVSLRYGCIHETSRALTIAAILAACNRTSDGQEQKLIQCAGPE